MSIAKGLRHNQYEKSSIYMVDSGLISISGMQYLTASILDMEYAVLLAVCNGNCNGKRKEVYSILAEGQSL